ncbi:interleukin-21 [Seriola dumerili]|uniref:interleukin-21 n=1 Tax=Seriola dumerili TaxID=41447 RepID=UPI000BBEACD9|nr:interleukin-21 [Seriola dumerili]
MKLVLLCLFAVCCYSLAQTTTTTNGPNTSLQKRKLEEALRQLNEVKRRQQHYEEMLNAPENIEDCCCLSALQCFKANMQVHFNVTEGKEKKLYNSLKNHLTVRSLDFCNSGNDTPTCQNCYLHPKVKAQEFFNRLESLIQRGITKLNN